MPVLSPREEKHARRAATARALGATAAIVCLVSGAVIVHVLISARPIASEARCEALLDRFVELRVRADNPKASDYLVEQRKTEARASAEQSQSLERCRKGLTEEAAACADRATSADELERCFP